MLKRLEISNYAIIEKIVVDFSDQLTIVTGETGAGKSILMGALGLILGNRADTKVLYDESKICYVEGTFDLTNLDIQDWFANHEIDQVNELVIRREISTSGKSRAFLNDGLTNLNNLKSLAIHLIDVFAQFDTLDIQRQDEQFVILDTVAGQLDVIRKYQSQFDSWQKQQLSLIQLKKLQSEQIKEEDYLRFQLEELESLDLKSGEMHDLEQRQERIAKAVDIQMACNKAKTLLQESSTSILSQLQELTSAFRNIHADIPEIDEILNRLDSSFLELEDLAHEIDRFNHQETPGNESLSAIEDRLSNIFSLLRKHQLQEGDQLLDLRIDLEKKLGRTENLVEEINSLESKIETVRAKLQKQANEIQKRRIKARKKLEGETQDLLSQLAMPDAVLKIQIDDDQDLNRYGKDRVEFLFTANLGGRLLPIKQVASGGELSRLNLCIKSIVAGKTTLPTLIFDEIDSGISGMVAEKMGKMIHQLAKHHQIISITHSPQIAAKANQHYFVYKEGHAGRTKTKIKELNPEERITEIATMLSTNPPSKSALANAKELLNL